MNKPKSKPFPPKQIGCDRTSSAACFDAATIQKIESVVNIDGVLKKHDSEVLA